MGIKYAAQIALDKHHLCGRHRHVDTVPPHFEADIDTIETCFFEAGEWALALSHPDRIKCFAETIGQTPLAWVVGASGHHERVMTDLPSRLVFNFDGKRVLMLRAKHAHRQHL